MKKLLLWLAEISIISIFNSNSVLKLSTTRSHSSLEDKFTNESNGECSIKSSFLPVNLIVENTVGTAQFIWESYSKDSGFGYLNGYKVGTTNQMPADTLLFGNFADLIIGQWGVLDVLVDPYALGTSGCIRIRLM